MDGRRKVTIPKLVPVGLTALIIIVVGGCGGDQSDTVATTTVTVTTPAPSSTTTTPQVPLQTLADAQDAIESNHYAVAIVMAAALGKEDLVRRRIANQIARRVTAAIRDGNRSRASFLLGQADNYPSTYQVAQARTTYATAKQRAAERAQVRAAAADLAAAKRQMQKDAASAEPAPASSGGGCDPNYSGCVPAYPPDVNCPDVNGPVQVIGSDPHGLDRDGDGVACE
jgi:hypothetical protein